MARPSRETAWESADDEGVSPPADEGAVGRDGIGEGAMEGAATGRGTANLTADERAVVGWCQTGEDLVKGALTVEGGVGPPSDEAVVMSRTGGS